MDKVVTFASNHINHQSWKMKYAALIGLGSIVEGPEKAKFMEMMMQALPPILNMHLDQSPKVR